MKKARVFTREMKLAALARMENGSNVSELARELKIRRKLLYAWRDRLRTEGPSGLRTRGRPAGSGTVSQAPTKGHEIEDAPSSRRRIAELERKIGQQQLELDFFRAALRQVRKAASAGPGATASMRSSKR
jgi:transposase